MSRNRNQVVRDMYNSVRVKSKSLAESDAKVV